MDEVFSYAFPTLKVQAADHSPMGYSVAPGAYKAASVEFVRMFAIVIPARGSGARPDAAAEVFAPETGVVARPAYRAGGPSRVRLAGGLIRVGGWLRPPAL